MLESLSALMLLVVASLFTFLYRLDRSARREQKASEAAAQHTASETAKS